MTDEMELLRRFIDEIPGPSTDAWARARAAIAAARAEEEPARHRPGWLPGGRPPGRETGRRRMLVIGAGGAIAAAAVGLLVALLPGSPGTGPGARVETSAFVTRVEHALSQSGQRNLVGYERSVYPPGFGLEPVGAGMMRPLPGSGLSSPWSVRYLVQWSYRGTSKTSAFTAAGRRVFDLRTTLVRGMSTTTAVLYRSGTWWLATLGPGPAANRQAPTPCGGPDIVVGPGGWPAFLRHELSCGAFTQDGRQRIGGIDAVGLTGNGGREMFWVNPRTYLPVREIFTTPAGARRRTDFGWFTPTRARLAELNLPVPPGFRQVPPVRPVSGDEPSHRLKGH